MNELRNYKFRLYPTHFQERQLVDTLDGCRWVYNYFSDKNLSKEDMQFALTELKEQEPFLRNYHSKMLQMVVHRIDSSRKVLQALKKNGHKVGKLHYLTDDEYSSFTYNQSGFKIENGKLWLSKIGLIRIRLHRQPVNIKQVAVKRSCGKWYAIVACESAKSIFKFINPTKSVGIDVGITKFAHDSDNRSIDNPLFLKKMLKPLRRASRRLSRRQEGSKNREKAKTRLQLLHERIRNKRTDFLHRLSTGYSKRHDMIFLERLQMLNMIKNRYLARNILDSGWGTFKNMLEYKAKLLVQVPSHYTSVDCSWCNNKVPKTLAVRTHCCNKCGLVIDRDYNAALNIKQRGLLMLPVERREVTPVEIHSESVKQELKLLVSASSSSH